MSVNITVNGKFTKQTILDDPERAKKELENKRRTLRLQQVRAQSKDLARKIRNDVSQEKDKQLRNLEAIKAQELNCWREHVLAQKCHDYQKSINEVGQAHKAAVAENISRQLPRNDDIPCTSKISQGARVFIKKSNGELTTRKIKDNLKQMPDFTTRKRAQVCFDDNLDHCTCTSLSDSEGDEKYDIDFTCSSLSSTSSLDILENTETRFTQTDAPVLKEKPPTPKVNVAVETSDFVVATEKPLETKKVDKDTQLSPRKSTACTQTSVDSIAELTKDASSSNSSGIIEINIPPRYTLISELIAKQKQTTDDTPLEPPVQISPKKNIFIVEKTTESTSKKSSPVKSPKSIPSRLLIAPKSSAVTILTPGTTERMASGSDSSSRVQHYDYRNKYSRQSLVQGAKAVPQSNQDEPNAMQQATIEKALQKKREEELEKMRQKSEERGQRALEREQVRRECIDLTEKLEALTQNQQNLLPTDANLHGHQYYSIKAARKESKLNGAIEKLLSRPAIITCPDVRDENFHPLQNIDGGNKFPLHSTAGDLNLGAARTCRSSEPATKDGSISSDSNGSILLGYIDDQRDNIRKEITQCETNLTTNPEKVDKLQKLLERIELLRGSLLKEINKNAPEMQENVAMENIDHASQVKKKSIMKSKKNKADDLKEKAPEMRVAERTEMHIGKTKKLPPAANMAEIKIVTHDNQIIQRPEPGKPVEIVIKVQSEKSSKKNGKVNMGKSNVTKRIRTEFKKSTKIFSNIPPGQVGNAARANTTRRDSYDSNSTAYRSIPPALTKDSEKFVQRMSQLPQSGQTNRQNETNSSSVQTLSSDSTTQALAERPQRPPRAHLNPLIAQYIQRLLAMSRDSVQALEVSSSEIDTPASSIVNITANMPKGESVDSLMSEDHVQRVERFITENRSFINELEESFRTHSNNSLETSLRHLEEAWKQKFRNMNKKQPVQKAIPARSSTSKPNMKQTNDTPKVVDSKVEQKQKTLTKRVKQRDPNKKGKIDEIVESNEQPNEDTELFAKSQTQLKHYAELTKNCSSRIAELTALITKVRAEKQRLLEITLTSVSDNERNSTEYRDLPNVSKDKNKQEQNDAATVSGSSIGSKDEAKRNAPQADQEMDSATVLPLEKHKKTGQSRDSGISMPSRPVTAMGHDNEIDPQSFVSSSQTTTTTHTTSSIYRKPRPPPTLTTQHRYSPQTAEDEVVHELSTIVEVDTPATSRLNTSLLPPQANQQSMQQHSKNILSNKEALRRFPTFDEYVRINNLDLTTLDHEQSLNMELEYNELIEALKNGQGDKVVNYDAFPTFSAYLQNLTTKDEKCEAPETFDDLFECLHLTPIAVNPFPSHREYFEQRKSNSSEGRFIDSDSLEKATSGAASAYTETESETIDIESELRRRNILKGSFRSLSAKQEVISVPSSSQTKKRVSSKMTAHSTAIHIDGDEKPNFSLSDSASEKFEKELKALGLQWPQTMRRREKQVAALNNSSSSEATTSKQMPKSPKKRTQLSDELSDTESNERPLNLRDFLTRQLLKHATATSSAESSLSGDSLRSQFFMAVLDSMTPSGSPRPNTNATNRNERQMTSTPVPIPSGGDSASSSTQIFSNGSNVSTVHPYGTRTNEGNGQIE